MKIYCPSKGCLRFCLFRAAVKEIPHNMGGISLNIIIGGFCVAVDRKGCARRVDSVIEPKQKIEEV